MLKALIFKDGFVGDIAFNSKDGRFAKSPLALFWCVRRGVFEVFTKNPDK